MSVSNLKYAALLSIAISLVSSPLMAAGFIPIGSTFVFHPTNSPDSYSDTTTFGSTILVDNGAATLSMSQLPTAGGGEWDIWKLTTTNGGPIAGNLNAYWDITMDYVLSQNVVFDEGANQWTVNGVGVTPTNNDTGICCATANDFPFVGGGFQNSGFSVPVSAGTFTNWRQIFISDYSDITESGIPTNANGFNYALHFDVPEPASLGTMSIGALGLLARRRRD